MTTMTIDQITTYFNERVEVLKVHQLDHTRPLESYKFSVCDLGKNTLGQCNYTRKEIALNSKTLHKMNADEIKDTINHEIAHALIGPGFGHGKLWKQMAKLCGATPKATTGLVSEKTAHIEKTKTKKFKIFIRKGNDLQFYCFSDTEIDPVSSYIPRRKRETLGKLVMQPNMDGKPFPNKVEEVAQPAAIKPAATVQSTPAKPAAKPATKQPRLQSLGGVKMSVLPTKVAQGMYQNAASYEDFIEQFMATGKSEAYANKNWKLCVRYFDI